jgi:iron complex outermembrane receptor protein
MKGYSGQYLRGDESNQRPEIPGYAVAGLSAHIDYRRFGAALDVENLLDRRYDTFGIEAQNTLGPYGSNTPPASPPVVPFLTPGLPTRLTLSVSVRM